MVYRATPEAYFGAQQTPVPYTEPVPQYVPADDNTKLVVLGIVAICFLGLLALLASKDESGSN